MPKIAYITKVKGFTDKSLALIDLANEIIDDYASQGYDLTLRQLYYQMVARDVILNNSHSYDNLGSLINDARMMGYIDWYAIVDRTRHLRRNNHWKTPIQILEASAKGFEMDKWRLQKHRPEVWVEKDALVGVIASICEPLDIPYFACRGYTSQSEMWQAAQRIMRYIKEGFKPIIYHLGDHDPSGLDMTRDIIDRLKLFVGRPIGVRRLALNWDQIQMYNPPPNYAKVTDSRSNAYIEEYGESSWELDALSPSQIADLIERAIKPIKDERAWEEAMRQEDEHKVELQKVADNWPMIRKVLSAIQPKSQEGVEHNDDGTSEYDFGDDEG